MYHTKISIIQNNNLILNKFYVRIYLILGFISLAILNCSNFQKPDETFTVSYPLSIGKTWVYETVILKLSSKNPSDSTYDTSILKRTIIQKDSDISGFPVYTFKDSLKSDIRYNYYEKKDDGIYSFLLIHGSNVMIKNYILDNLDNVRPFLLFPSTFKNKQTWETHLFPNSTIDSLASITLKISFKGREKVFTKIGVFDCFVFEKCFKTEKSILYIDPDIGMVKQIFISYENILFDTDNYSYSLGNSRTGTDTTEQIIKTKIISLISYN